MTTLSDDVVLPLWRTKVVSTKTHHVAWNPCQVLPMLTNQNAVCYIDFCSTRIRNFAPKAHLFTISECIELCMAWDLSTCTLSQETQGAGWTWPGSRTHIHTSYSHWTSTLLLLICFMNSFVYIFKKISSKYHAATSIAPLPHQWHAFPVYFICHHEKM